MWKLQHKIQISAMTLESKIKVIYDKCLTIASEFLHIKHTDCLWCVVNQRFQITDMTESQRSMSHILVLITCIQLVMRIPLLIKGVLIWHNGSL